MAKSRKLTEMGVERIRPDSARVEYPDLIVQGLRLIVQPSGKKSWAVRTRLRGKPIKYTIGPYPTYKLSAAREAARDVIDAARLGQDPRVKRRVAETDTVEAVVADWLKRDQEKNRDHRKVKQMFEKEIVPRWQGRPITEITRRDAIDVIDGIVDRGAEGRARRVHAYMHRMFRWAVGRGIIEINPMADLPKPGKENPRDRVLTDLELFEVWRAAGEVGYPYGPAIQLLILTGARQAEIGRLTWQEVDEVSATIQLTGERTKTGNPRLIPLTPTAMEIIGGLPRLINSVFVFTSTGKSPINSWGNVKKKIDRAIIDASESPSDSKGIENWRFHDLRRTVATGLQRLGCRLEVIEAVLGHVSGSRAGIVGVYQRHSFDEEKHATLSAWDDFMASLIAGEGTTNVIPLKKVAS